ncbi:MAG TPA: phosphatidate cytidylyltransferase [Methylophaga sp.]|nr:phosphatidate cytidylyltransferase [Methylophaga sp.]
MLKQRLLTAAILIPLIVLAILLLPSVGFLVLMVIAAGLAGWEWLTMIGVNNKLLRTAGIVVLLLLALLSLPMLKSQSMLMFLLVYWLVVSLLVMIFAHRPTPVYVNQLLQNQLVSFLLAVVTLSGFIYSALWLHGLASIGPQTVIYLLIVVWLMDTGGYFFGKRYGKHKLATAISPNKTWEGLAGGLLLTSVVFFISIAIGLPAELGMLNWLALTILAALASVIGDLFESLIKRSYHIKDSGQLLPGHGGILDRVDSLLAASPVFAAGLYLAGVR